MKRLRDVPPPEMANVSLKIPKPLLKRIKTLVGLGHYQSLSEFIRIAVLERLKEDYKSLRNENIRVELLAP